MTVFVVTVSTVCLHEISIHLDDLSIRELSSWCTWDLQFLQSKKHWPWRDVHRVSPMKFFFGWWCLGNVHRFMGVFNHLIQTALWTGCINKGVPGSSSRLKKWYNSRKSIFSQRRFEPNESKIDSLFLILHLTHQMFQFRCWTNDPKWGFTFVLCKSIQFLARGNGFHLCSSAV